MKQAQEITSTPSQNQLVKHGTLLDYVQTKEEADIVQSVSNSIVIGNLKEEDGNKLLDVVSQWRAYIGIPKTEITEELSIATMFIFQNFGHLTLNEVKLAFNLAVMRKLQDVEFRGFFSPDYIARVLYSYQHYRKNMLSDATRRMQSHQLELQSAALTPSPEAQAENMKHIMSDFYAQYQEQGVFNDPLNIAYNFLRKHKMVTVSQAMIDESLAYGKKRVTDQNNGFKVSDNTDALVKMHARNYIVQNYFKNVEINVLLNNIQPEKFIS